MPAYLKEAVKHQHATKVARFRLGCHWLAVETGRWADPPVPRLQRVCDRPLCRHRGYVVEDEQHAVFECMQWSEARAALLPIEEEGWSLRTLFSDVGCLSSVAKFLQRTEIC
jgi:hypothetical protein